MFEEACVDKDSNKWMKSMRDEMESLKENHTWDLDTLPSNWKALQNKWVYRLKKEAGGKKRFKDRLVFKGYAQQKGALILRKYFTSCENDLY
jgi:hypothetical protein